MKQIRLQFNIILLLFSLSLGFIQLSAEGQKEKIPLAPEVRYGILSNGLRYYVMENQTPENRAILRLAINSGSLMEDDDQLGMAHFLEHMAFNGTEKYAENDLVHFLQSIGMQFGPDINAHTSFDETVYKLMIPLDQEENLTTGLDILEEWAFKMSLNDKDIEEERGIILEEWRRSLGASRRMMDAAYPDIMYKSLYGERLPIGTEDSIQTSSPESIRRFYKDWYRPDLMAIVAVGDFDADVMVNDIRSRFSPYKNPERSRERLDIAVPDHRETVYSIQSDPEASWTAAIVFNKFSPVQKRYKEDFRDGLIEDLYVTMFNYRMDEILNSPAPPFTFASADFSALTRQKSFHTMTVVSAEGELYSAYEALMTEAKRILDHGFTAQELSRARKDLYASYFKAYNNKNNIESIDWANAYVYHFLDGVPAPGMEYEWTVFNEQIEGIKLEDIQKKAENWLGEENRVIYTMSPESEDEPIDPIRLSGIQYKISQNLTEAPLEKSTADSLLTEIPQGGEIVLRRDLKAADAQELTLSNGVRVVYKKTDYKENEILFSAMSPGGISLAENEDYLSASFASQIIIQSGVGNFSKLELDRIMTGSTSKLQPSISEMSTGLRGSSTREDLESLFQLSYLYFTEPRLDQSSWETYRTRMANSLRNRDASPMTQYSDLLISLLYQDHPRSRPLKEEMLSQIDAQRAYDFYKARYAQASNFTFFISGSFDEKELEQYAQQYLGALPNQGDKETWVDRDMRYPEGLTREELKSGQDPLSYVTLIYPGEWDWSRTETQIMQGVADSMQMILTEEIREKSAGTYSPSVSVSPAKVPYEDYYFMISFSCDPHRTSELTELVKTILSDIKAGNFEDRVIQDVIKARSVSLEDQLKKNQYWLSRMERSYFLELPEEAIPGENLLIDNYSREVLQNRVQLYFSDTNNLEVILYPED